MRLRAPTRTSSKRASTYGSPQPSETTCSASALSICCGRTPAAGRSLWTFCSVRAHRAASTRGVSACGTSHGRRGQHGAGRVRAWRSGWAPVGLRPREGGAPLLCDLGEPALRSQRVNRLLRAELAKREQRHPAKEGGLLLAQLLAVAVKLLQCAIHAASRWPGLFLFDCWGGKRANCQRNVFYKSFVAYVQTFWTIH